MPSLFQALYAHPTDTHPLSGMQVTCSDWTMIPAENLVSAVVGTPTRIALEVGCECSRYMIAFPCPLSLFIRSIFPLQ